MLLRRCEGRSMRGFMHFPRVSTMCTECVISAVLASIAVAEQYFSCDNCAARSTASRFSALPRTVNCISMRVNTFGSSGARSAVSCTEQPWT
jgi:hypothetical protein